MSRNSKLILATALFGAALFGASCGGGGGGTTAGTGTGGGGGGGGGGGTPSPTEEGRVLAQFGVGSVGAVVGNPVRICRLMSNKRVECGSDLNPSADEELHYVYEFDNGNVVLRGSSNKLYFFDGTKVEKLDKFRPLGATSATPETPAPDGITIPAGATYYATRNFVIMLASNEVVAVSKDGKVIRDNESGATYSLPSVGASCEAVNKTVGLTTTTYELKVNGTSSDTTIPILRAEAGEKYLVQHPTNNKIYLSDSICSASGLEVATISSVDDAKMVKVGNDFYIAVRVGRSLHYYEVLGTRVNNRTSSALDNVLHATGTNEYYYALDGRGRLYVINTSTRVNVFNTDGTGAGFANLPTGTNLAGLLGLADRVLARDTSSGGKVYQITTTGFTASWADKGTILYDAVNGCTHQNDTRDVNGVGTNFIRCVHENSSNTTLYSLTYDSGSGLYGSANRTFTTATFGGTIWATNKALVKAGSTIRLCTTTSTTTPTISCNNTDLPALDPTDINSYLKFNGNNVFYRIGTSAPFTLKVGNIFDPPSALPITVSSLPSGGNASFNLNKFAFSFGPESCRNQILYFSSRTATPERYDLPSGTCVKRILKVY